MIKITFNRLLTKADPQDVLVCIVGRLSNLLKLDFETIKCKLEPRVTEEVFKNALRKLKLSDMCSLYLNTAIVAALPFKCSRHNTPSRCHTLTRLVQSHCNVDCEIRNIVIVCEYEEVFASGCAVAKAFPLYTKKTGVFGSQNFTVAVEFIIMTGRKASNTSSGSGNLIIELLQEELLALDHATYGIGLAARITDTPCNEMNVDNFLNEIHTVSTQLHVKETLIRGRQLADRGLRGIYCVGQAATQPPALAVLSYTPPGASTTIAWVGKGVVFDSGGLSMKGKTEMLRMKHDCGGAAAILGAFYAIVRSNFSQNLHAVFCIAENAVGPLATRPEDIYTLYSGRTVEINNTDAEGRLMLADGVVYAKCNLNADIILDMATLTGSQGLATGMFHAAVLTNSEDWEQYCMQAGRSSGDLVFPIPYAPELHFREFDSAFADMKNTMQRSNNAPSSCAGLFINAHLGFDFPGIWIHIDMAATVHLGDRATAYGVALLCILFGSYCKQPLLKAIAPKVELKGDPSRRPSSTSHFFSTMPL